MEENKLRVRNKGLFITLTCLSVGGLFASFAYPLQKIEVWRQEEPSIFGQPYSKIFVLAESDKRLPYGLNRNQAEKIATIYEDASNQKMILLATALLSASAALAVGSDTVEDAEIQHEVKQINAAAKKEVLINKIKHKWAMASEAQKQLYRQEYAELVSLFGEPTQEATEMNQTDKFINASYMLQEGHSIDKVITQTWNVEPKTEEFERLKKRFQEWLDNEGEEE